MRLPGFTAEAALYRSPRAYRPALPHPTTASRGATVRPAGPCDVTCEYPGEIEYHANPCDCSSFYQCSWGEGNTWVPYFHPCPEGLHFNPTKSVCDWPQDAGCAVT